MPTELVLTTRMLRIRDADIQAAAAQAVAAPLSGAVPPSEPEAAPFDRRPTAPIPRDAATEALKEAGELIELVDEREAALLEAELAQTVVPVRPRQRTPVPPPPAAVTAVAHYAIELDDVPQHSATPRDRHAAAQPSRAHRETPSGEFVTAFAGISGEIVTERRSEPPPAPRYAVGYGPAPMHRADAIGGYAPAALRHAVNTHAYGEQATRHASASAVYAAPMHRADATSGYAPAQRADFEPAARHRAAANGGHQPTPPRRASGAQWRAPNLQETEPDGHYLNTAGHTRGDEDLTQVRRQLAAALESARKHELRAKEAELRASWAERYVPQLQDPEQEQRAQLRKKRLRWLKRVLEVSCVGLALGGYISLLVPVRERVIAQDAMIHQLTVLQQQLRDEKRALLQRIEQMQATTPP